MERKRDRECRAEAEGPLHPRVRCTQEEVDGPLHPLVASWEAARHERDWARADAIRDELRAKGINPGARQRADHGRYDAAWAERTRELRCISTAGFLASSLGWEHSPKLQTFRGIDSAHGTSTCTRDELARQYGRGLRAKLTQPGVLCVEKPYLAGLIEAFEEVCTPIPSPSPSPSPSPNPSPSPSPSPSPLALAP